MLTTYSTEGRIENGLRELQCSGRNFIKIAKASNIQISDGKFSEAMSAKGRLDTAVSERLLNLLEEMRDLQTTVGVPLDWSSAEDIREQLSLRREAKKAIEEIAAEEI